MYQVFICYSEDDIEFVSILHDSLNRICEIDPYVADFYRLSGKKLKDKIMDEIPASEFIIVLLTESGVKSQWVNQEIGFACAYHEDMSIIPVREDGVVIKAFLEGSEYTEFHRADHELTIAQIIYDLRSRISENLHIKLECPFCSDVAEYPLADKSVINDAISASEGSTIEQPCNRCQSPDVGKQIIYNPKTLEQIL